MQSFYKGVKWVIWPICFLLISQVSFKLGAIYELDKVYWFDIPAYWILFGFGYLLFLIRGIVWVNVLKNVDLSLAYPLMSLSVIIITVCAYYLFDEPITIWKLVGSGFILFGGVLLTINIEK